MKNRPTMLIILDGFGVRNDSYGNAVAAAKKPNLDKIYRDYSTVTIAASGEDVGLPDGQMGNSEVGHLNIGAGRIVYQDFTRVSKSIRDGDFFENPAFEKALANAALPGRALHIMGLLSDGGVHSHNTHLYALLQLAKKKGLKDVYIHCFLDGRDVPPRSSDAYLAELEDEIAKIGVGRIVTIEGRYYAMDRDNRWERVQLAYDAITLGNGIPAADSAQAIQDAYASGENDEFVTPRNVYATGEKPVLINDGDSVIFFNFRPDRAREITRCFVDSQFAGFEREKVLKDLCFVTLTSYDATMPGVTVAYPPQSLKNTLGEYISSLGLKQLRIAETEKYAHVTFFFNGGVETPNPGEERILIKSPSVATYDLKPEMSAYAVADAVVKEIESEKFDLIILNFANPDMVGHTGIMEAATEAIEAVDACVGRVVAAVLSKDGQILLTADHGNAELMMDEDGNPVTAHTTNPVPLSCIRNESALLDEGGRLSDLAPTLLALMGLPKPSEMSGRSLLK
ncbi:MAG: 2,3-bisphosphoglycerate-independent phosphoglycerate mutase [Clostridiales Family XIII bacterium]|nr:2,3-bisphosphoglycerate-independent phosphoglycerate mutase [Clostridiales Family XIII bacterium]